MPSEVRPQETTFVWEPSTKQAEFLAASEYEVLYGGAAGGGKTDGLLVDAMGLQPSAIGEKAHIEKRAYQAIIFRKTFPDLKDIIDRSHEIYRDVEPKVKYDKQAHVWTFPSGARIEFGYIQRDIERLRYRGRAFQYVGWEELTLWPTLVPYVYLISRIRTTDRTIPCYVRATTNPDGPGHRAVKERFQIPNSGKATCFQVEINDPETGEKFFRTRRFIPARVSDNPHLAADYRTSLLMLPGDEQDLLLRGRWDTPQIKGSYWNSDIEEARKSGRITSVPHEKGILVDTWWDLGVDDETAIWFTQTIGHRVNVIDYHHENDHGLPHFQQVLEEKTKTLGYRYGRHVAPHDIEAREWGTGANRKKQAEALGIYFDVCPRPTDKAAYIDAGRRMFSRCWFDADRTSEGVSALENYRKEWDPDLQTYKKTPLHDWASHGADAWMVLAVMQSAPRGEAQYFPPPTQGLPLVSTSPGPAPFVPGSRAAGPRRF